MIENSIQQRTRRSSPVIDSLFLFPTPSMSGSFSPAQWARALAILGAIAFPLCFLRGILLIDPVLQELHRNILRMFLFDAGFVGANITTLLVGTIVSAVWGAIAGSALAFCLNHCEKR